jgi:hypothetical protein
VSESLKINSYNMSFLYREIMFTSAQNLFCVGAGKKDDPGGTPHLLFSLIILGRTTCAFLNERNKVLAAAVMPRAAFTAAVHHPHTTLFLYAPLAAAAAASARASFLCNTSCLRTTIAPHPSQQSVIARETCS